MTNYSIELGLLDKDYDYNLISLTGESVLTSYSPEQKKVQLILFYIAPFFCLLPESLFRTLPFFAKQFWLTPVYKLLGGMFTAFLLGTKIFPGAQPKGFVAIWNSVKVHLSYLFGENKNIHKRKIGLDTIKKDNSEWITSLSHEVLPR